MYWAMHALRDFSMILLCLGFMEVGGYSEFKTRYMNAVSNVTLSNPNTTCGYPREDAFHIFRDIWGADYPSAGTFLRTVLGGLWYWCANQVR